jgi:hypothetical protein
MAGLQQQEQEQVRVAGEAGVRFRIGKGEDVLYE